MASDVIMLGGGGDTVPPLVTEVLEWGEREGHGVGTSKGKRVISTFRTTVKLWHYTHNPRHVHFGYECSSAVYWPCRKIRILFLSATLPHSLSSLISHPCSRSSMQPDLGRSNP